MAQIVLKSTNSLLTPFDYMRFIYLCDVLQFEVEQNKVLAIGWKGDSGSKSFYYARGRGEFVASGYYMLFVRDVVTGKGLTA